jgi:hypothetical protein
MQLTRDLLVRAWRELRMGMQRDAFKLASTVWLLDHYAGNLVAVFLDDDSCIRIEVEIPELMAHGERCDQKLFGVPPRRITSETRIGRTSHCLLCQAR